MIQTILVILVIIFLFITKKSREDYNNDEYENKKLKIRLDTNKYINFYGDLNEYYKDYYKNLSVFSKCDKNLHNKILKESLKNQFGEILETGDVCNTKAIQICEFVDPRMYISENKNFQPKWTFKPYQNIKPPRNINLKCWETVYNCCKSSI